MDTPQEVQVWLILPALRRQLAISLKVEGMKQKEIAKALNLTEAAVSQYVKKKRGEEVAFNKQLLNEITKSAKKISLKKSAGRQELQTLLRRTKETKLLCNVCHNHTESEEGCEICFI